MTNNEAMNQLNAAVRALFSNFIENTKSALPDDVEHIDTLGFCILSGQYKMVYQIEMLPLGIRLEAAVAYDGKLARVFSGVMDGDVIAAPGSPFMQ